MFEYKVLKSGTDIRGVACEGGGSAINLTDEVVKHIAEGFLIWCEKHTGKKANELKIAVGHDSRISADRLAGDLFEAFQVYGVTVYNCNLASTPSMFMATLELPCDASVQITASHHPFFRNGFKFFTPEGGLEAADISEILGYAQEGLTPAVSDGGSLNDVDYMTRYAANLREIIKKGVNAADYEKPLAGMHIIVDAGNGAGGFYASSVLEPLGADTTGSQFLDPDGMFPNHIPNPEDPDAMASACKAVRDNKADMGVIFDTDVDRGGAVDGHGDEINRNRLIAIASVIALEGNEGGTVVTDSITSDGLKVFIEKTLGGKHLRFKRGYKNVINESKKLNAAGINSPLAIETSGHAALRENYFLDDGAYLCTKIIILAAKLRAEGRCLEDLLKDLPEPSEAKEVRFPILADDFRPIGEKLIADLEAYAGANGWAVAPDNHEGIRISFPEGDGDGWFLLRMSVHDPIMPLNVESNIEGGVKIIAGKVKEFLESAETEKIDYAALEKLL